MPTPTKGPRLGGSPAHERLMLANLATALFQHGKIKTTETKAKRLRPLAEQLITKAKRGDLQPAARCSTRRTGQGRGLHPVRPDRAAVRQPSRWLHPDREDRPAQGRQRSDGDHRAGRGAGRRGRAGRRRPEDGRPQGRAQQDKVEALAPEDEATETRPADADQDAEAPESVSGDTAAAREDTDEADNAKS